MSDPKMVPVILTIQFSAPKVIATAAACGIAIPIARGVVLGAARGVKESIKRTDKK